MKLTADQKARIAALRDASPADHADLGRIAVAVRRARIAPLHSLYVLTGIPERRVAHLARKYGVTGLDLVPIRYEPSAKIAGENGYGRSGTAAATVAIADGAP